MADSQVVYDTTKGAVMVVLVFATYMLPSFFAAKKKPFAAILVLNLMLGWTFLGWIGALVWALAAPKK